TDRCCQSFRRGRRAHHEVGDIAGPLRLCQEHSGPRLCRQPVVPDVTHHAHNFGRRRVGPVPGNAQAEWIFVPTVLFDERLIHQRRSLATHPVLPAEWTAPQNGYAHRSKVSIAHYGSVAFHALGRRGGGPSYKVERNSDSPASEREKLNCADRSHLRQSLNSIQYSFD